MTHNNQYKLSQYASFAVAFLLTGNTNAQAVFTDIDPDIILDNNWETAGVDMNNDGIMDFGFLNRSFDFSTYYSFYSSHLNALYAGPQSPNNEIAALTHVRTPFYGGFTVYFPFALNEEDLIDESLIFHNEGYQTLAYLYIDKSGFYFPKGGIWYPEVLDHYLGVRFYDTLDCLHYGWIRCDVTENGKKLIIKDYAYETKCETGIYAGDIVGDTTTIAVNNTQFNKPTIYNYNNTLIINIDPNLIGSNFSVSSTEGKLITAGKLNQSNNTTQLICPPGIYIVTIKNKNYNYSGKIVVE